MVQREKILVEIEKIIRKELDNENLVINFESSTDSVEKWDSINNLIIISSIEEHFNMTFPIEVIFSSKNVGDICDYILNNSGI